ncbi:hypothetical protein [Carnobacterium maltaromaticum]|uniref:hypothetical protein n=1 Tax=Carnobacterium maltaromaticum TaxID=2751 RepID=UPI0039B0E537
MNKYKLLAVMSIGIFLTGCKSLQEAANKPIESYQSSIKEESSANELSDSSEMKTIDSNEGKPMVTEKFEVLLPQIEKNKEIFTDEDINLFNKVQTEFNNKDIQVYENSLSFLSGYSYYDSENGDVVFTGILVNNTSSVISDISGVLGNIQLKDYSTSKIGNGNFILNKSDVGILKPKQAMVIVVSAPVMITGEKFPENDIIFEEREISAIPYGFGYKIEQ